MSKLSNRKGQHLELGGATKQENYTILYGEHQTLGSMKSNHDNYYLFIYFFTHSRMDKRSIVNAINRKIQCKFL